MSDGFRILLEWLLSHLVDLQISALAALATLCWWAEKLVNAIAAFLVREDLWTLLLDGLLDTVVSTAPDLFQLLVFSPTGLFYMALSLAGILLIIGFGSRQIAEPSQVILWGVLVSVLFVSTTLGYDLVQQIEAARRWTATQAITLTAPNGDVSDLIAIPMRATTAEANDLSWSLPAQFEADFYEPPSQFTTQSAVLLDTWLTGQIVLDLEIEDEAAQEARKQAAWQGVLLAVLTLAPAAIEAMFGLIFATIAASVLVLIVFFLASLPLGFFSFGKGIIQRIVSQYFFMWALTLAGSIFVGLLLGTNQIFLSGNPTIATVVGYLPLLVIVSIAIHYLLRLAFKAMQGTLGMVSATLRATVTEGAQNTAAPDAGDVPLAGSFRQAQDLAGLAALGVAAAATGGVGMAIPALAGGMLSRTSPKAARDAAVLARISSGSAAASTFAAAAVTRRALPATLGILAVNRNADSRDEDTPASIRPAGSEALARATLDPDSAGELAGQLDPLALSRLSRTARQNDLDQADLAELFRTVRGGLERAVKEGIEAGLAVREAMDDHPAFDGLPGEERWQLGRQAADVIGSHQDRLLGLWAADPSRIPEGVSPEAFRHLNALAEANDLTADDAVTLMAAARQALADETIAADSEDSPGNTSAQELLAESLAGEDRYRHLPPDARLQLAQEAITVMRGGHDEPLTEATTPETLAQLTQRPALAPPQSDVAALYQVGQLAQRHGFDEEELAAVYQAAQAGRTQARQTGASAPQAVYREMGQRLSRFNELAAAERVNLARNALLVVESIPPAQVPVEEVVDVVTGEGEETNDEE